MIISEIFYSLQGEGRLAGVPTIFIRLAGCPLRCTWCDTKYAWDPQAGQEMSFDQILEKINDYPTRYVVLTGGEPMANDNIVALSESIHSKGYHITIETAGIRYHGDVKADLMSISPKLSNAKPPQGESDLSSYFKIETLARLISDYDYQLKFVVDTPKDLNEIAGVLEQIGAVDIYKVYLMPQATETHQYVEKSKWLVEYCKQTGFSFSPRLQVMLWGSQRGK